MSSEFLDEVRGDLKDIVNGDFSIEITVTPNAGLPVVVQGLTTVHSLGFDGDGLPIIAENSHCGFIEKDLNDLGVITRSATGGLLVQNWIVEFDDAIGRYKYKLKEPMPDKGLGYLMFKLSKYNG